MKAIDPFLREKTADHFTEAYHRTQVKDLFQSVLSAMAATSYLYLNVN